MRQRVQKSEVRAGPKILKCNQCSSTFRRSDHMKRHALSHHTTKRHICSFCSSGFSRGDVLRRHWRSCKARVEGDHAIPKRERGGKHKRACDSCASLRKACSEEVPCNECNRRGKRCTYERLSNDGFPLPFTSQTLSNNRNAECSTATNDHTRHASERSWDLGPATLYPPTAQTLARRSRNGLGSPERSIIP